MLVGHLLRTGLLALTLSAAAVRSGAQEAAAPSPTATTSQPEILVTAPPPPDEKQVRRLVRAITPNVARENPMARFTEPVCFATAGLPRATLIQLSNRMVRTAQAAGIRLGGEKCRANVLVMFVDDGRAEVERLAKRNPWIFSGIDRSKIAGLLDEPGPVHVWSTTEIRSRDGDRMYNGPEYNGLPQLNIQLSSFVVLPIREDILFSVLLIDRKAAVGRNVNQIADYAAMRTLAMTRATGAAGANSILTLFDPDPVLPPMEMTDFDRGYLKALYIGQGNQRSTVKVRQIGRAILRGQTPRP